MNIFERIIEDKKLFSIVKKVFIIGLIVIALLEIIVVNVLRLGKGYFWFENLPAFGSIYGFISCIIIIVVSKFLLPYIVAKKEDYYD